MQSVIGNNLKRYRLEQGFTLKKLSGASGIKVSTLNAIEKGRIQSPSFPNLRLLAKALSVPQDCLLEDAAETPPLYKGDLKGAVEFKFKKDGLTLISYTPLMKELFVGKAVLEPKKTFDFKKFPRLAFLFVEVIFGKLDIKWETKNFTLPEGENLSLRSPQGKIIRNPFQMKETSFLLVTKPSLIAANLESQKPLT